MADFDLVIRGGEVVDGSGAAARRANIAITGDRIVEMSAAPLQGRTEIDATGCIVTPGFVDIHTHYDGQATWESRLRPSSSHGVTTVVMGNCGVGFAPCRASQRQDLIRLMEGVEDIPNPVLTEGLPWTWESYPDFLDVLAARAFDVDVATYVPHSALRVYVMGQRALDREPATAADLGEMSALLEEGLNAGALGFGTSRTTFHKSSDGRAIPTFEADEAELGAFADVLARLDQGVLQIVNDFRDTHAELALMRRLAARARRPVTFSLSDIAGGEAAGWQFILRETAAANAAGQALRPQILPRPIGVLLGHELTLHPFVATPSYRELSTLPLPERIARLRLPEVRARILQEPAQEDVANPLALKIRDFERIFELGAEPDYEPPVEQSLAARAARAGVSPLALAYDLLMNQDGRALLYVAMNNYREGNLEATAEMMRHPNAVFGLGDGGAHCGSICDASYTTHALQYWGRDRTRGARIPLPDLVRSMTRATAETVGLFDRGLLAPGHRADVNVIALDRLKLHPPEVAYDLPAGGRRLVQRADGYVTTLVAGVPVYRDGIATGELPGRLVRGGQASPTFT